MTTTAQIPRIRRPPAIPVGDRVTPGRVLRSEWIKFRTLRSSWLTLVAAVAAMLATGLIVGYATSTSDWSTLDPEITAPSGPLQGLFFAQLLIGVLGALFVTGEYGTGMIRATFAAVPRRLPVLGAKAVVFGGVALVAMTLASFAAFFGAQIFLSADGHGTSLSDPGVIRVVAGVGVYLALVGLLGAALGWIIRSTAGAIGALVGIIMVLPVLVALLPGSLASDIGRYLPSNAGQSFGTSITTGDMLAPWTGLGVFVAWVVVAFAVAAVLVRRRDA